MSESLSGTSWFSSDSAWGGGGRTQRAGGVGIVRTPAYL